MSAPAAQSALATEPGAQPAGPVAPAPDSQAALRPVPGVRITGGLWHTLQQLDRAVTLEEAFRQLEEAGNLSNFRVAAGEQDGPYRGKLYLDSDVYKTLEAVAWEQGRSPAGPLAEWQETVTDLVARAQRADGYLNTYVQVTAGDSGRYADLPSGHELFCGGHLIQAGVAQARATGRRELLEVACRYADHLVATFGPGRLESTDGHPEIEMALVELYRETEKTQYLDLARFLIDVRGHGVLGNGWLGSAYFQDDVPVRQTRYVRGHAVRAVFLAAGVTDLYLETGEPDLLGVSVAQWEDMVAGKTYLTGGIGSRWEGEAFGNAFELPPDVAYAETCAAHGSVLWSWRLLLATGEARYADLIERTLYNGFASGLSLDGRSFFYVNALQNRPGPAGESSRSAEHGRQPWYRTACCPPNIMRTLATLQHYLATTDDNGVQVHLYATGSITVDLLPGRVAVHTVTDLPWDGRVEIGIDDAPGDEWTLSLRIPSWALGAAVSVNGTESADQPEPGGYLRLRRAWRRGDVVVLSLPCVPRLTVPDPRIDAVRGSVALERGPLVYCFEQVDQPEGSDLDLVRLLPDAALVDQWQPDLLGGVVTMMARARTASPLAVAGHLPYGVAAVEQSTEEFDITAVPYFRWANRELGPMRVFIPTADQPHAHSEENR